MIVSKAARHKAAKAKAAAKRPILSRKNPDAPHTFNDLPAHVDYAHMDVSPEELDEEMLTLGSPGPAGAPQWRQPSPAAGRAFPTPPAQLPIDVRLAMPLHGDGRRSKVGKRKGGISAAVRRAAMQPHRATTAIIEAPVYAL